MKLTTVVVLAATLTLPLAAHADDLVSNSCGVLIDAAKARAEQGAEDLLPHLSTFSEGNDEYSKFAGAANLPPYMSWVKKGVPARAWTLARDAAGLNDRIKTLQDDEKSLEKDLDDARKLAEKLEVQVVDRHGLHSPKKVQPQAELDAKAQIEDLKSELAENKKKQDALSPLLEATMTQLGIDMRARAIAWDSQKWGQFKDGNYYPGSLGIQVCTQEASVSNENRPLSICGWLSLKDGTVTYSVASLDGGGWGGASYSSIADIGAVTPVAAAKDPAVWASIRHSLRERQIAPMPEICKTDAHKRFEKIAESEGAKSVNKALSDSATESSVTVGQVTAR